MAVDPSMTWDGDPGQWNLDSTPWDQQLFILDIQSGILLGDSDVLTRSYMVSIAEGVSIRMDTDVPVFILNVGTVNGVFLSFAPQVFGLVEGAIISGVLLQQQGNGNGGYYLDAVAGILLGDAEKLDVTFGGSIDETILLGFDATQINQASQVSIFEGVWLAGTPDIRNPWDDDEIDSPEIWTEVVENGTQDETWTRVPDSGEEELWTLVTDRDPQG